MNRIDRLISILQDQSQIPLIAQLVKALLTNNENEDEIRLIVQQITPSLSFKEFEDVLEKTKLCSTIKKWILACLRTVWEIPF